MIRPEAAAALRRWREVLVGLAALLLGLYWAFLTGGGLLHWVGYVVAFGGAALILAGLQRARFRQGGGGPGIVQVIEGRISYFGPLSGGIIDLEDLRQLTLDQTARPAHWMLHAPGQPPLAIPTNAEGADQLFDAFATLPGIRTEHMLRQMHAEAGHVVVIWQSPDTQSATRRLH